MRLLGALLLVLLATAPAQAALADVQTASCSAQGAATCTTGAITSTTGNLFVASSGYCCANFVSVTDSPTNTYTNAIPEVGTTGTGAARQDYKENGTGGASHTFTLTGDGAGFYASLSVIEISGARTSSALDQIASGSSSGTSHGTPSTSTTTQAAEILVGVGSSAFSTTFTTDTGAGWVEQTNIASDASTEGVLTGTRIVAAASIYAYTFTTGSSVAAISGIATYKEAASAAGARQRCVGCGSDPKVIE